MGIVGRRRVKVTRLTEVSNIPREAVLSVVTKIGRPRLNMVDGVTRKLNVYIRRLHTSRRHCTMSIPGSALTGLVIIDRVGGIRLRRLVGYVLRGNVRRRNFCT